MNQSKLICLMAVLLSFPLIFLEGSLLPNNPIDLLEQETTKNLTIPDPYQLPAGWWHYFEAENTELQQRVKKTIDFLDALYQAQSPGDQETILPLITSIKTSLSALPAAKEEKSEQTLSPKAFQKSYTLQQQLQLHQQKHKLQLELKTDQAELTQLKQRIAKSHQRIDSDFALYSAGKSERNLERLLAGLEIICQRAALGIAEENRRLIQTRLENQEARLALVTKELEVAKASLDVSKMDETILATEIDNAQKQYERAQRVFARAEAEALSIHGRGTQERASKHLLAQKLLRATIQEALAWSDLTFQKLSYTLVRIVNKRFEIDWHEMQQQLFLWKEDLHQKIVKQKEWEQAALQEQSVVRQDQSILLADNQEGIDHKLMDINKEGQRVIQETLTVLHLLEEKNDNLQWIIDQLEHHVKTESHWIERVTGEFVEYLSLTKQKLVRALTVSLFKVFDVPFNLLSLFRIIFIFALSFLLSFVIRRIVCTSIKEHLGVEASLRYSIGHLIHYSILTLGTVVALWSIGLNLNHVLILAGALTFGIGFGLQSVALNFFAGLKILFERKIKMGDYIELSTGHNGTVTEINIQSTMITTPDGLEIVVPNSDMLKTPLVNWTMNNTLQRLHIRFSVASRCDKALVRKVVQEAAKRVPCTLKERQAQVWLVDFAEEALTFELVVWVDANIRSYTDSKEADYRWEIETALRDNDIKLPIPEHLLYLKHVTAG